MDPTTRPSFSNSAFTLRLDPPSAEFGEVPLRLSRKKTLTLSYDGREQISLAFSVEVNPPFVVSPRKGTLKPGQVSELTLSLPKQVRVGELRGTISIAISRPRGTPMEQTLAIPVWASITDPTKGPTGAEHPEPSPPHWNSWIRVHPSGPVVKQAEPGTDYDVNFDLASFNYSMFFKEIASSTAIDIDFQRELENIPNLDEMEILVVPVILGTGLRPLSDSGAQRTIIHLGKLRQPPQDLSTQDALPVFSEKARAAQVSVAVHATGPGCAAVALAIWSASLNRPLDHVVRQVSVGASGSPPACGAQAASESPVTLGVLSLLALPFDRPADAALHVFETKIGNAEPVTAAVFVQAGKKPLYWNPARKISDYVSKDGPEGLRHQIELARCAPKEEGSQCVHDYSALAGELTTVLFHDDDQEGQQRATDALAKLGAMTAGAKPNVFVRLVDVNGSNLFLPLGLLGLGPGRDQFLGQRANLMTPLPKEKFLGPDRCIGSWTMVLPEHLADVEDPLLRKVDLDLPNRIASWKDFRAYAATSSPKAKTGEGFLLLAHHGGGRVTFDPHSIDSLTFEGFQHAYPDGSVAILAGCSIGQLVEGMPLLKKLNERGVSAAILSPFDILGSLGARFAMHFANEVEKARGAGKTPTLAELFEQTLTSVRGDPSVSRFAPELDELLLVGNGTLQLCRKEN